VWQWSIWVYPSSKRKTLSNPTDSTICPELLNFAKCRWEAWPHRHWENCARRSLRAAATQGVPLSGGCGYTRYLAPKSSSCGTML